MGSASRSSASTPQAYADVEARVRMSLVDVDGDLRDPALPLPADRRARSRASSTSSLAGHSPRGPDRRAVSGRAAAPRASSSIATSKASTTTARRRCTCRPVSNDVRPVPASSHSPEVTELVVRIGVMEAPSHLARCARPVRGDAGAGGGGRLEPDADAAQSSSSRRRQTSSCISSSSGGAARMRGTSRYSDRVADYLGRAANLEVALRGRRRRARRRPRRAKQ